MSPRRRLWIGIAVASLIIIPLWITAALIPDKYEASARVYIDVPSLPHARVLETLAPPDIVRHALLGIPHLENMIAGTGSGLTGPAGQEQRITGQDIIISQLSAHMFTIAWRGRDPKQARDIIQALLAAFVENVTPPRRQERDENGIINPVWVSEETAVVQIVNPPELPLVPVAPNRPLLIACIVFAGITAGFLTSRLQERLVDRT